ncbi:hypothetical protein [Actinomycetospora sp. NBC_00405]|uniref:hypothetical protein n=1 Tax=Actinomycetospora sp. NBC_00405 TaxID=2975952 RepID=UPI002E223467
MPDALLVMDFQAGFPDLFDEPAPVVERVAAALEATRGAGAPVVHLRVAFPPDGPPVPRANRMVGEQFRLAPTVLSDAVDDPDPDLHAALLRGLLPQHARVLTVAEHLDR